MRAFVSKVFNAAPKIVGFQLLEMRVQFLSDGVFDLTLSWKILIDIALIKATKRLKPILLIIILKMGMSKYKDLKKKNLRFCSAGRPAKPIVIVPFWSFPENDGKYQKRRKESVSTSI